MTLAGATVIVTGSTGLLGRAVCRALIGRGARVTGISRSPPRDGDAVEGVEYRTGVDLARDATGGPALGSVDLLIHCAARIAGIRDQRADPFLPVTDNLCMSARVIEACARARVPLFFVSSSTVYSSRSYAVREDEADSGTVAEVYEGVGNVKRYLERVLLPFAQHKYALPYWVVRPTALYGPGDHFDGTGHVIPDLLRRVTWGESPLRVWGDPAVVRDFLYVDDAAEGILAVLERGEMATPYNLGSGLPTTLAALADVILRVVKVRGVSGTDSWISIPGPAAIPYRQVDTTRLCALGWKPAVGLEEGLARTLAWARSTRVLPP